jgi:hypothetical protein
MSALPPKADISLGRQRQRTYCWEDQWQAGPWSPRQLFPLFLFLIMRFGNLDKVLMELLHLFCTVP